jgi:hypothetical protein
VSEVLKDLDGFRSIRARKCSEKAGASTSNPKYFLGPIAYKYREGKMKSIRKRRLKEPEICRL